MATKKTSVVKKTATETAKKAVKFVAGKVAEAAVATTAAKVLRLPQK